MKYAPPGQSGSIVTVAPRYENFIGGKWLAPTQGKYRADLSPATARPITEVAHSTPEDVEFAFGLGAGVWTRDGTRAYTMGRAIKAGRVRRNCYHQYPAGAAFGGYKISGIGRENHRMMLDHYSQTKNLLVSYDPKPLGLF